MKLIIAGSRTLDVEDEMIAGLLCQFDIYPEEVVCGMADGVDHAGLCWADHRAIKVAEFPAMWGIYGKRAGVYRNSQMADYADALLLIWDGKSKGSANMKKEMKALSKPIYEVVLP